MRSRAPILLVLWLVAGASSAGGEEPSVQSPPGAPAPQEGPREAVPPEAASLDPWMPLTIEDETRLRDLLWRRVILLAARPRASDLEEPGLAPVQNGQAIRTTGDRLCTAMLLLEGAGEARLTGPDGRETVAAVAGRDAESLVAWLACAGPCRSWPEVPMAPESSRVPGHGLLLVLPSLPDQPVLSPTVSLGAEASPFPGFFAVAGRLPPGTLLFDGTGAVAGLVVRGHPQRADRSLAVPTEACRPRSETPAKAPSGGSDR
ncbi:MAG TPA: hypothetical protein PLQ97_06800 [Myxococcota bacterium]|nr:hypothetical protein [Myxococcota bacterium]HQK50650.1 hypothetical protein [Myxococcota bacterium]